MSEILSFFGMMIFFFLAVGLSSRASIHPKKSKKDDWPKCKYCRKPINEIKQLRDKRSILYHGFCNPDCRDKNYEKQQREKELYDDLPF